MKRLMAVILLFAMALSLCGCKNRVTMEVQAFTSGHGIAGQDFSGYEEYKVSNIKEGDVIVGGILGSKFSVADDVPKNGGTMMIYEIDEEGVTIILNNDKRKVSYGVPFSLDGGYMYDGPNTSYLITFTK